MRRDIFEEVTHLFGITAHGDLKLKNTGQSTDRRLGYFLKIISCFSRLLQFQQTPSYSSVINTQFAFKELPQDLGIITRRMPENLVMGKNTPI